MRRDIELMIHVPGGSGESGYYVTLKGTRLELLKAICDIYGGSLEGYYRGDWVDIRGSEQTANKEVS
jgi:hypothetical protein